MLTTLSHLLSRIGLARPSARPDAGNPAVRTRVLKPLCILLVAAACMRPLAACATSDCFLAAASYQHVNPLLLRAIAWQESHANVSAVHRNRNGSFDYGIMQINSVHLPALAHFGIDRNTLMNPCVNVFVAAWILRSMIVRYGNTWQAVGAYHSRTPAERGRYARAIEALVGQMETSSMENVRQ